MPLPNVSQPPLAAAPLVAEASRAWRFHGSAWTAAGADLKILVRRVVATTLLLSVAFACEPTVVIGARACPSDARAPLDPNTSIGVPWTTGFEDGFCDYASPMGFCFATGSGSLSVVTSPVHSGQYAAAFSVQGGAVDGGGAQVRCVQQGLFPSAAYYGAWYYVPEFALNAGNWNLLHFQGGVPGQTLHGLWDVSLVNLGAGGPLHVLFFDFLTGSAPDSSAVPPIPLSQWFHLEVYFKRAKDATGELSVWQDGVMAVHLTGLRTDDTDWGQWYVGNLAAALVPGASTVYVDDVTIGSTRPTP
jgi:hypothetical protein